MSTGHAARTVPVRAAERRGPGPWWWFAGGLVLFFAVPWLGADLLGLEPDLYYLLYFTAALAFLGTFEHRHREALRPLWRRRLGPSLLVGAAVGLLLLFPVLRADGTPHPDGWRFGVEILWRGLVYGSVDALVLVVFPAAVAFLALPRTDGSLARHASFAGLALLLSVVMTAAYHLGYPEYRGEVMRYPQIGAIAANVPTSATGNPVGALLAHPTMHVAAVVHQYDGGDSHMLPPDVSGDYPSRGSSDLGLGLAIAWMAVVAGAVGVLVGRRRRP